MIKLDKLDKKLLMELDLDSRQPYSQLAKKLNTSQQVISYRTKKLVDSGVITSFVTTFSSISLGLNIIKIYIQYSGMTKKKEEEIYEFLSNHKSVNWISKVLGNYDLFVAIMVKDISLLGEFKAEFFQKFGKYIGYYTTSIIQRAYTFPRPYLSDKNQRAIKPALIHKELNLNLDRKERLLIKEISNNSRISVIELSKKLDLNVKTILKKISALNKSGVIQGYRINIDRGKIGQKYYKIFIKLKSYDPEDYKLVKTFCLGRKYLVHLIECVGEYEIELEMEISESERIEETIQEIRNNYSYVIARIESCEITNEMKLTWLPNGF